MHRGCAVCEQASPAQQSQSLRLPPPASNLISGEELILCAPLHPSYLRVLKRSARAMWDQRSELSAPLGSRQQQARPSRRLSCHEQAYKGRQLIQMQYHRRSSSDALTSPYIQELSSLLANMLAAEAGLKRIAHPPTLSFFCWTSFSTSSLIFAALYDRSVPAAQTERRAGVQACRQNKGRGGTYVS